MVAIKKKGPLLSEYIYSLFGTCVNSNKLKFKNVVLESPWILRQKKCTNRVYLSKGGGLNVM